MDPRVEQWLERDPDGETREVLRRLVEAGDEEGIESRFEQRLQFGTAGLRGVVGVGPGRMNRLVVCETSMGLAAWLEGQVEGARERGVVVGFDARPDSRRFAADTAAVLTSRGFVVHLFDRVVATPICAFSVVNLGAAAGVVVTASHNPPEYNGYKVYWENGAQIIPPHDSGIAAAIEAATSKPVPELGEAALVAAREKGLLRELSAKQVETYFEAVLAGGVSSDVSAESRAGLTIAYTPLHGVGAAYAESLLERAGYTAMHTVASQREPDGTFPTVRFPNPEEPGAMDAVVELAGSVGAALAVANDPDADRLAVAARDADGGYEMLSGNQIGALLGAYAIRRGVSGEDASGCAVATTVVSSRLLRSIAESAGVTYFETLTGFKWIANGALSKMATGLRFLFGYEEALGYMVGSQVRDKDGLSAMLAFVEMASELAAAGKTVLDALAELYREHGLHLTDLKSRKLAPGTPGSTVTDALREAAPERIGAHSVEAISDLRSGERVVVASGEREALDGIPESDVLIYELSGGARVVVRPSGTEPKVKCYYELRETVESGEDFAAAESRAEARLAALVEAHQAELP